MKNFKYKFLSLICMCAVLVTIWDTDTFAYKMFEGACNSCNSDYISNYHNQQITVVSNNFKGKSYFQK